jgi:uncharacterized membrane protein YtjA (UPF0391 family)
MLPSERRLSKGAFSRWRSRLAQIATLVRAGGRGGGKEPVPAVEVSWMTSRNAQGRRIAVTLLKWALIFFVISIIAGVLGFTGISAASADVARILFYVFLVIFLVLLILGLTIFRV